jgi:hypothetical protein
VARAAYEAGDPLEFDDFVCSGVHVRLHARPMSLKAASSVTPGTRIVVGTGPAIGGLVNSHARLKKRLEKKRAKPYRLSPGVPFIIVVSNHDIFGEGSELMQAIFGWDWERIGTGEARMHPNPAYGGFFGIGVPGERPRHPHVSAVAVIDEPTKFCPPVDAQILVFDNPHANVPLPSGAFPTTHRFGPTNDTGWAWHP